jgi:biopolymer transport protein ExbD
MKFSSANSQMKVGRRSPLMEAQHMGGKSRGKVGVKELAQALPLTSLIDAFSIIVIYLLIGTQSGGLEIPAHSLTLPVAQNSQALEKEVAILRIQNNQLFLNDQPVSLQNLGQKLADLKKSSNEDKNFELMVQADQNMQYADLDPLIKAGSLAGIEKLKFAVLPSR